MGRDLKTGVFQRLDQETAHVVVVFGEQDFGHGRKRQIPRGYQQRLLSPTEGKFGVKIFTLDGSRCRLLVNRNAARINRSRPDDPRPAARTVKTCSSANHIFSLGRMVAIPDNDDT
jgi:hypothetical protein